MASTLTVDNIVGATTAANVKMPAGAILQTVTTDFTNQTSVTSSGTTYTDVTGGAITISPKYNNSKILIIPNITLLIQDSASTYIYFGIRCVRGSSTVLGPTLNLDANGSYDYGVGFGNSGTRQFDMRVTDHHIDTPATTSATTYKFQVINYAAGRTTTVNHTGASSILAMEIAV
tara:strand:- start:14 stop:538 length:525 start_codon:yes stop_codon:yes gene_type:complete